MLNYLKSWNLVRFIRFALGLAITIQGVLVKDYLLIGVGAWFSLLPVLNIGCGVNGSCGTNPGQSENTDTFEDVQYEEIKQE